MGAWDKETGGTQSSGAWSVETGQSPATHRPQPDSPINRFFPATNMVRRVKRETPQLSFTPIPDKVKETPFPSTTNSGSTQQTVKRKDIPKTARGIMDLSSSLVKDVGVRWPVSAIESMYRLGKSAVGPEGSRGLEAFREKYKPIPTPLGPVASIQTDMIANLEKGDSKASALGKATFSTLADEPIGIAIKPLFLAMGVLGRKVFPKSVTTGVTKISKAVDEKSIYDTLIKDLGIQEQYAKELAPALKATKTVDEVIDVLYKKDAALVQATKPISRVTTGAKVAPEQPFVYRRPTSATGKVAATDGVVSGANRISKVEERTLADIPTANIDDLRTHSRAPVSDAEAFSIAKILGFTEEKILKLPIGTALNKEQQTAVSGIVSSARNILENMDVALKKLPEGSVEFNTLRNERALQYAKTMKLVAVERGLASEAGRALEATKRAVDGISQNEKNLAKFLNDQKNPQEAKDWLLNQFEKHSTNPEKMVDILRKTTPASYMEMLVEFATAMKLTAPSTHAVNLISTAMRILSETPLKIISGGVNALESLIRGTPRQRLAIADTLNNIVGQTVGFKEGWRNAGKAFMDEDFAFKSSLAIQDFSIKGPAIKGKPWRNNVWDRTLDVAGKGVRMPFRLLGVEDTLLRVPAQNGALVTEAGRSAYKKGLKFGSREYSEHMAEFMKNPPASAVEKARKSGAEQIFQEDLGPVGQKVAKLRNDAPVLKLFVPFMKTIVNLAKQGLQFSPASVVLPSTRKALQGSAGARADILAKMALGTAMTTPLTLMALDNKITGPAPKNPAERDKFYNAEGKQPYSVLVNGKWYPVSRFSPFSEMFVHAKLMSEALKKNDENTLASLTGQMMFSMSRNILDKSFAKGLTDLIDAISDENVDPETGHSKKAELYLGQLTAGTFLPTALGAVARATDENYRDIDSFKDVLYSRIPGLSKKLPGKLDVYGFEITRAGSPMERFMSPMIPTPATVDIVSSELEEIGISIGFPTDKFMGFEVPKEQQRQIRIIYGKTLYNALNNIVTSPHWDKLPVREKVRAIETIRSRIARSVREQYATENIILNELADRLQDAEDIPKAEARERAEEVLLQIRANQQQNAPAEQPIEEVGNNPPQ